jgi:plasmid stabilization system protein ParE
MILILHKLAQQELNEIVATLEDASLTAAERFEAAVKEALAEVLENPFLYHFANRYRRHRRFNIKKFNRHILYTVDEPPGVVHIVAFKHDRQHPDHGLDRTLN